ncbi:hypothetical protein DSECCO2_182500 [anaerobic digester metagenome]|nr:hypothetical protein [Methanomassiliicoccales archaeon]
MTYCMVTHSWKSEQYKLVARKVIEALQNLPKGTAIISSHVDARLNSAWCVYETGNPDELVSYLVKSVPEMTSQAIPVIQFFPPCADLYKMIHVMSQ